MTKRLEEYKCNVCGNIVGVLHASGGTLVCCNQPMQLLQEKTIDAAREKHVPVIEKSGDSVTIRVGAVTHPMEPRHYIEWIELICGEKAMCKFLKPGDGPFATFECKDSGALTARAYCNLHGLWKS